MQQDELGYFGWVIKYLDFYFEYGYRANPFELDAWTWERDITNSQRGIEHQNTFAAWLTNICRKDRQLEHTDGDSEPDQAT
jgi:hypothetical protein